MVEPVKELADKVAIVTGSARNIGRATALELARGGAALVINARQSKDLCEDVAHEIESMGGRALPFVADITDADAVARMVAAAKAEFGGIDILVNNAAGRTRKPFIELDLETWHHVFGAAVEGAFHMTKGCESRMAVMSAAWFVEFRQRLPWLLHVD